MKKLSTSQKMLFQKAILLLFALTVNVFLFAQEEKGKVVFPEMTIVPNDADLTDPLNFQFLQVIPVGDINGDGFGDLVYNVYTTDERTPEWGDNISKSVIVTKSDLSNTIIRYNSYIAGTGDYNGDGIDDYLDCNSGYIYYGSNTGIPEDSLFLAFTSSNEMSKIIYSGDINDDGYSEIIVVSDPPGSYHYTLYSGPDANGIPFIPYKNQELYNYDGWQFHSYDYDNDGMRELCSFEHHNNTLDIKWFYFDKENEQITMEHSKTISGLPDRTYYTQSFSDINGDGLPDICTSFYAYDSVTQLPTLNLEVAPGLSDEPYFGDPVVIDVWNNSRLLYFAGDFNGDGYDDLYSKTQKDSIVIYYGNPDVFNSGFQKIQYFTGNDKELLLKSRYLESYYSVSIVPKFYYDNNNTGDLFFNYWSLDENLRFDVIGTAIVTGGNNPDFENPVIIGKSGTQSFKSLSYGYKTKTIKDLNQDGFDDYGILAQNGCYLDIFYGKSDLDTIPDLKILLPQDSKQKTEDWTSGDINGDGWTDIIISNSSDFNVVFTFGVIPKVQRVYIFYGKPSMNNELFFSDADVVIEPPDNCLSYAKSISVIGDYNNDGVDDLVIGGNNISNVSSKKFAYLYFGGNDIGGLPDMKLGEHSELYSTFALPVTPVGDVNADGYDDVMLGNPSYGSGKTHIYYGGPDADTISDVTISNPVSNSHYFGSTTSDTKGDFDGDGVFDILQYSYAKKMFFVYKGGMQFDNLWDVSVYDSTYSHVGPIEFIDRTMETGFYDVLLSNRIDFDNYELKLYQGGLVQNQDVITLKDNPGFCSLSVASGDFNNDGLTEIIVGFPFENEFGWKTGGIAKMYVPANFVYTGEDENIANTDNDRLLVYPNPVTSEMNVKFTVEEPGEVTFTIFDITGKSIKSKSEYFAGNGTKTIAIDPRISNDGLYILEIKQKDSVARKKFVFQEK